MSRRLCCLLLLTVSFLGAQEAGHRIPSVTLERACELALAADAGLKQSELDLSLFRTKAGALWAQVFPSINAGAGLSYGFPLSGAAQTGPSYQATLGLSLGLNAGLPFLMKSIRLAYRQGLLNFETARRHIVLAASKSFYSLIAEEQNLAVLESEKNLADEQLERDTAARRIGYKGELEYMQSRLSAERARFAHEKALASYRSALADFCAVLGLDETETIRLEGAIETEELFPNAENLITGYLPSRPDLAAGKSAVEKLRSDQTQKNLAARAPSLNLSASWGTRAGKDFVWNRDETVSAGLSVTIPVNPWIPRTKENQELAAASVELEKARIALKDLEDKAKREIRSLCTDITTLWNELEIASLQADIAQRTFELSREAYRMGTISFLDFESSRNKLTEAGRQLLTGKLNYKLMVLELASKVNMDETELITLSRQKGSM